MAKNKTPMFFTSTLIFFLLVVTGVESRKLGDVSETQTINESSPTITTDQSNPKIVAEEAMTSDTNSMFLMQVTFCVEKSTTEEVAKESSPTADQSNRKIVAEEVMTSDTEPIPITGSESMSTIDDIPETIESISSDEPESIPNIESMAQNSTRANYPAIGKQFFIGRQVEKIDEIMRKEIMVSIHTQNYTTIFVGGMFTLADTPHNRMVLDKERMRPKQHIIDPEIQVDELQEETSNDQENGEIFTN